MNEGNIWIISAEGDQLSPAVSEKLKNKSIPVLFSYSNKISEVDFFLNSEKLFVNGKLITGILFRARPDSFFSESFVEQDQPFCDSEIGAVLLAALNLPSILAVNKYDARLWFDKSSWALWRSRYLHNQMKVSPFHFGSSELNGSSVWLPYNSFNFRVKPNFEIRKILGAALTRSHPLNKFLVVGKKIFHERSFFQLNDHIELLNEYGIFISEITTDSEGNIITVNTLPAFSDERIIDVSSNLLVYLYYDFLSRRRS
jgi:hypothetical protein